MKMSIFSAAMVESLSASGLAFAQGGQTDSAQRLQAGDNVQTQTQSNMTPPRAKPHNSSKMQHGKDSGLAEMNSNGTNKATATPSGPGAPVTASGSGQ